MKKNDEIIVEKGVIAGNIYDKYGSTNPIVKYIMKCFLDSLLSLVSDTDAIDIHEIGCGEGNISIELAKQNRIVRACDLSEKMIQKAKKNAELNNIEIAFNVGNIYDLVPEKDAAGLIVCCEVLEHLEKPDIALNILQKLANPFLIISVPSEPLWSILNIARFKYIYRLGNTPGHIQRWTRKGFQDLLSRYFDVIKVLTPIPWTMVLCRANVKRID